MHGVHYQHCLWSINAGRCLDRSPEADRGIPKKGVGWKSALSETKKHEEIKFLVIFMNYKTLCSFVELNFV